jgi:hypothetical protein
MCGKAEENKKNAEMLSLSRRLHNFPIFKCYVLDYYVATVENYEYMILHFLCLSLSST